MPRLPAAGQPIPVSTYRVQLRPPADDHPGFGFDDAAAVLPYLADLGITHLYCSPYLQAARGSAHGYDVVDHTRLNAELGGQDAFDRLAGGCQAHGLGLVLDIVPNHMAVSEPEWQNAAWWAVLREGRSAAFGEWFDIDWDSTGQVLLPILAGPLEQVLSELTIDGDTIRYYDHVVPIAPDTLVPGDLAATLARQHYRLGHWREGGERLNYRRFFDVTTLAGVRVELASVFDATHRLVIEQLRSGLLAGVRIDHPDGLADPAGYLARLAEQAGAPWVVVEKILEPGEQLPADWACAGTTGYDALNDVLGVFVDPAGEPTLTALWESATGSTASFAEVVSTTKHLVLQEVLAAEVNRLTDVGLAACGTEPAGRDATRTALREALVEVLASFEVYRAYVSRSGPAGPVAREQVRAAVSRAAAARPDRSEEIALVGRLALAEGPAGPAANEFVTRFQQTCGPVMAKGVEDTAFYRYLRLAALNEVGGDPGRFGLAPADFHAACALRSARWPVGMTTLSTHDTKRSEDVRARLVLLSQCAPAWAETLQRLSGYGARHRTHAGPDASTEVLVWQTLVGAWPLPAERLLDYLQKATREAKVATSWLSPNLAAEEAVAAFGRAVLADEDIRRELAGFVDRLEPAWQATALGQKLVQLTMPGVADTYQGTELFDLSLVDPDNRRPVDYLQRSALLTEVGAGAAPASDRIGRAKLHVTTTALRLRRAHPEWFLAPDSYAALDAGPRALAFSRSDQVVTVVPVRAVATTADGWGEDRLTLPAGNWWNALTGRPASTGQLGELLADFPVALLVRP